MPHPVAKFKPLAVKITNFIAQKNSDFCVFYVPMTAPNGYDGDPFAHGPQEPAKVYNRDSPAMALSRNHDHSST